MATKNEYPLSDRALLARLSIGVWSGRLHDEDVSEAARRRFGADEGAGSYTKQIIAPKFLNGVAKAARTAKSVHELLTLPWQDGGTRIMTVQAYNSDYMNRMRTSRTQFEQEVRTFLNGAYSEAIDEARVRLKMMFKQEDYPTAEEAKGRFSFDIEVMKVPEAADFRVKLSDKSTNLIVRDIEKRTNERIRNAQRDVFGRVFEVVEHMSTKLREYRNNEGTFKDSLVYNVQELAEMLPMLNVTDDPRITELGERLKNELAEHSPTILRGDAKVAAQVQSNADRLLKRVQQYMTA